MNADDARSDNFSSSTSTTMLAPSGDTQILSEEQVIQGFHLFLQTALAQAKAEKLLDTDTLASAEADLMISGPALCLFFGALRSSTDPPSVPLPRGRSEKSMPPRRLSKESCPPTFKPFVQVWASSVPAIQALASEHQHDLARVICGLEPLNQPVSARINRIAADLRAVAIEISQRRTFQERYQADLQAALDAGQIGRGSRRGHGATAHFEPPPMYNEKDTSASSSGSRTPEPEPEPEPKLEPEASVQRSASLALTEQAITLIRETLFASLADVMSTTPSLCRLLDTDPPRAYFSSVALAVLNVSLISLTAGGGVRGVLGRELTLEDCPGALRPLMQEFAAIGREAQEAMDEDDEAAMRLAERGKRIPEPRMDRVRKIIESGVGYDERERRASADEDGRRSLEGRAVQFANRVNKLALTMTGLPAFKSYAKDVFDVLRAVG